MRKALHGALAAAALAFVAAPTLTAAVDPFYRHRMEAGVQAFERGDWGTARRQLRIACFGYLEEPVALAGGLVRLAVAQAKLDDDAELRSTFLRLIELEERFGAYSETELPPPVRDQFEEQAARRVPLETLRFVAGFEAIAARAEIVRLGRLPVEQRRLELAGRLEDEPQEPALLVEMARLELQAGRPHVALRWLERLPAERSARPPASCLRQQAATESRDCAAVDLGQPFCANVPISIVEFRLQCLVGQARWPEASALLKEMPEGSRASKRVVRLERRVLRNVQSGDEAAPGGEPPGGPVPAPPEAPGVVAPAPEDEPGPATVDPAALDQVYRRLVDASTPAELAELFAIAGDLADQHPDSRRAQLLAGEIAYLNSEWRRAVAYFGRAGELREGEEQLAFYLAVALYESGDRTAAAGVLEPVAPRLERTSFVQSYLNRILVP